MDRRSLVLVGLLCAALGVVSPPRAAAHAARHIAPGAPRAAAPLAFEANAGQTDGRVRFVSRAAGCRVFLTDTDAVVATRTGESLRLRFAGPGAVARVEGDGRLAGTVNYLVGRDPSAWRTNVPTFARVRYQSVRPGVDAVFYGNDGRLEHDFVVAPGADPHAVEIGVSGADRLRLDADGALAMDLGAGSVRLERPAFYQEVDGARRAVTGRFAIRGADRIGFDVGAYDVSRPLVIDPVLSYSTFLGGTGDESGAGVTTDAAGNAYVVGGTSSLDFPISPGAYSTSVAGSTDGFVTKLNADGTGVVFSTYFGGAGDEGVARAAVDASGTVYVVGGTGSTNFPTTSGAFQTALSGTFDAFAAKLNSTGTALVYSTLAGGSGDDGFAGVAVDASGNAFVTGASTSSNYPTTPGAFDTSNQSLIGLPDAIVTKINPTGTGLVYSTYLGAAFNLEAGAAIAIDASGNAYVTGGTNGGFPTTGGAFDTSFNGGPFDGFVTKVNPTGTGLVYSTYLGGSGEDYGFGIAVDASGNAYVTGYISSTNFPVANAFQANNAGGFDAYVTKVNASGNALVYSSYLGGSGDEGLTTNGGTELQVAGAIAVDASGNAYLTGFTNSTDFPVVAAWQLRLAGEFDAWVAKIGPTGASKVYASYLGGAAEERGLGIAVDGSGNAYVTGFTLSSNFPTTAGVLNPAGGSNALTDGFLAKIGTAPGDTAGIYVPSTGAWFLRTTNTPGAASTVFTYGPASAGFVPLSGDWDGNGTATAGLYDPATGNFFLKNTDRPGGADIVFSFGAGGADILPLVGDWNNDGTDTVAIYSISAGAFFLRNSNASGPADLVFTFGAGGAGIIPLAGDWNGDGTDSIGIYSVSSGAFFLRNSNAPGGADVVFSFGAGGAGIVPLVGDWNGDGTDTVGLYASGTGAWFLRNANASGAADVVFTFGPPGATPVTGHWGG